MTERHKRYSCKEQAKKAYAYYKKYGVVETIVNFWRWLLAKPDRLTALSTFAIFLATAVATVVGIAQWRALRSTDEATHTAADAATASATLAVNLATPAIYVGSMSLNAPLIGHKGDFSEKIIIKFGNVGQSVAIARRVTCIAEIRSVDDKLPAAPSYNAKRTWIVDSPEMPKTGHSRQWITGIPNRNDNVGYDLLTLNLSAEEVSAITDVSPKVALLIYGFVEFKDIADRSFHAGFGGRWYRKPADQMKEGFTETGLPDSYTYARKEQKKEN